MKMSDALIGTWKLNVAKSNFWAIQNATMKEATGAYRQLENDLIEVTATGTRIDGSTISLRGTFPRQGGGTVTAEGMSYVVTVIDPYSYYLAIMQNGKQILLYHSALSKDGKTKLDQFKGTDDKGKTYEGIGIWDRQ